jgi:hypothetical protein
MECQFKKPPHPKVGGFENGSRKEDVPYFVGITSCGAAAGIS